MSERIDGWLKGMDFARAAQFPQYEPQVPAPDGPVTRAWLDGFAAGILTCHEGPDAEDVKAMCKRLRNAP